jgi:hypothetical protein
MVEPLRRAPPPQPAAAAKWNMLVRKQMNTSRLAAEGNAGAGLRHSALDDEASLSESALDALIHQPNSTATATSHNTNLNSVIYRRSPLLITAKSPLITAKSQQTQIAQAQQAPATSQAAENASGRPKLAAGDSAQMVDFVSSILFPLAFIIFNLIYWSVYLNIKIHSNNY